MELAGTAPASARLSWLVVYRLRSFEFDQELPVNDQKVIPDCPEVLANTTDRSI